MRYAGTTTFSSSSGSNWYIHDFIRPDGTLPAAGNVFIALPFGPILSVPATMVVNGVTYGLATLANPLGTTANGVIYAYQIVHRTGAYGWSPYSNFGLEWQASSQPATASRSCSSEDYTYNDVPYAVQQNLENWRLAGTDVQAHQGVQAFLQFSLAIIYDPAVSQAVTQAAISTALSTYLSTLGFSSRIYPSSVLQAVESTPGVIASRFLTGADYTGFTFAGANEFDVGIQLVYNGVVAESYVDANGNPIDIEFGQDTIPVFGGTVLVTKAGNTMGGYA